MCKNFHSEKSYSSTKTIDELNSTGSHADHWHTVVDLYKAFRFPHFDKGLQLESTRPVLRGPDPTYGEALGLDASVVRKALGLARRLRRPQRVNVFDFDTKKLKL